MIPLKTIEDLVDKHALLEKELSSGSVDKKLFAKKSKEYSSLGAIILYAREFLNTLRPYRCRYLCCRNSS